MCKTCETESCRRSKNKMVPAGWNEKDFESDGMTARKGDTLVAIQDSGTGEGIHWEEDIFEGKECQLPTRLKIEGLVKRICKPG